MSSIREPPDFIQVDRDSELRCPKCGKLLAKGVIGEGTSIEIKCPRSHCKTLCRFKRL